MTLNFFARPTGKNLLIPWSLDPMEFPGGEMHFKTTQPWIAGDQIALFRGADSDEFMTLALWADAVAQRGEKAYLYLPYLPAARADRGIPFGARTYANLINSLGFERVVTIDPHSPVMPDLINRLHIVPVHKIMKRSLRTTHGLVPYRGIIAPDEGAVKRAEAAGRELELEVFTAKKHRDFESGRIASIEAPELPEGRFLVVDDICDGGGTFVGLADALGIGKANLDIWITHGVFSGAWKDNLLQNYTNVFTTDSHPGSDKAVKEKAVRIRELLPILHREAYYEQVGN